MKHPDARPGLVLGLILWAAPLLAHGPLHEEIVRLTAELQQQPDDPVRLARRGELLQLHGLPDQAGMDFERLAILRPADVTNDFRLGQVQLELGATNEAVRLLERFANNRPLSAPGQLLLARALVKAGRPHDAAEHFAQAVEVTAEPVPDWYLEQLRALRLAEAPRKELLRCLDAGIARLGPLPVLQLPAVELEVQLGYTDNALARLDALAARAERKERWLVRRGDVLKEAGRIGQARVEYLAARQALETLPDKLRRAWTATELRQQIEAKLAALPATAEAGKAQSP